MADNITAKANTGSGTDVLAADDIAGVLYPRTKLVIGADGANDGDVSSANPLPVTGPLTDVQLRATSVPVTATLAAGTAYAGRVRITDGTSDLVVDTVHNDAESNTENHIDVAAKGMLFNGTSWDRIRGDITNGLDVDVTRLPSLPTGSNTIGAVSIADPSTTTAFGPISAASTVLFAAVDTANENSVHLQLTGTFGAGGVRFQASNDGTTYFTVLATSRDEIGLVDTVFGPCAITIPVTARFFRAVTTPDFAGSISGVYALRNIPVAQPFQSVTLADVDPALLFPVAGVTPGGYVKRISLADNGGVLPADGVTITGSRQAASVGTVIQFDATGYSAIALQLANVFTGTVTFQASNDGSTWASVAGWPSAGGAAPVTTATAVGQWIFPVAGRFFRVQVTTGGSGVVAAIATLKNGFAFYPASTPSVTIAANSAVNVAQIAGTNTVTGGVAGIQAVGGNIAVGAAPTANPVPIGGWDGTNTRRILTDASSGGIVLGVSGVTSGASVGTLIAAASNNLTQIKGTIGRLYMLHVRNQVASVRYVKLFNLPSASVTMGTTNATLNFSIPASGELNLDIPEGGLNMGGTGISFALVTGEALNNNTAVAASDLIVNYSWA